MKDSQSALDPEDTKHHVFHSKFWENYFSASLSLRLLCAFFVAVVWVAVLYPYQGTYYPEGNWLAGPLWLFKIQASGDKIFGLKLTALNLPLIVSSFLYPTRYCLLMSLLGVMLWIGIGMWLAMLAVV